MERLPTPAEHEAIALARLWLTLEEILSLLSGGMKEYSRMASEEWSEDNLQRARLPSARRHS